MPFFIKFATSKRFTFERLLMLLAEKVVDGLHGVEG